MKLLLSLIFLLSLPIASGASLDELNASYESQLLRIASAKEERLNRLRNGYQGALEKIRLGFQKAGRLDEVLLCKKEDDLITANKWPLPRLSEGTPSEIVSSRKLFLKSYHQAEKTAAKGIVDTADKMLRALERRKTRSTKAGKLDEAQEAMNLGLKIEKDPAIVAARNFLERSRLDGSSPAAVRIRRSGDQIEVIVRYDLDGKISMNSKIENVVEETDGKKEKGDTTAKVLGEFVGAKGYQAHPYTAYHQNFKKGELGAMTVSSFDLKSPFRVDGEFGVKITVPEKALNSHLAIPFALPTNVYPGAYRVTCRYFIPEENVKLKGFYFHQGFGAPVEDHFFKTKGEWVTKTVSSDTLNEHHYCRLYPHVESGTKLTDYAGDSIVLGEIKVEQTSFTAYLHSRFGADRQVVESFPASAAQKIFISAGKLLTP
ncbi:hypothetical protein N9908_03260 [Akkermansiaceae bacterium]|nr:hypothetical protein [Akkermansiaceae bacterium]